MGLVPYAVFISVGALAVVKTRYSAGKTDCDLDLKSGKITR